MDEFGGHVRFLCRSDALLERGPAVRFTLDDTLSKSKGSTGFVVRFEGIAYAYVNECAHVPTELDGIKGEFFDHSGLYLICATHGAIYEPESGRCVGGPCRGARLKSLPVREQDGAISLVAALAKAPQFPPK